MESTTKRHRVGNDVRRALQILGLAGGPRRNGRGRRQPLRVREIVRTPSEASTGRTGGRSRPTTKVVVVEEAGELVALVVAPARPLQRIALGTVDPVPVREYAFRPKAVRDSRAV